MTRFAKRFKRKGKWEICLSKMALYRSSPSHREERLLKNKKILNRRALRYIPYASFILYCIYWTISHFFSEGCIGAPLSCLIIMITIIMGTYYIIGVLPYVPQTRFQAPPSSSISEITESSLLSSKFKKYYYYCNNF